jgi:hypothetical protein
VDAHVEAALGKEKGKTMATKGKGKASLVARAQQLSAGVAKHLGSMAQVMFTGGPYTPAQITSKLQSIVTLRADVDAAKATTKAKVAAERADTPALGIFVDALVAYVKATFGGQPEVLADFGISTKTRTPLTVEQKAAAAAKRTATRAARGTKGAKQKKGIKGDVVGITVTPVTASKPVVTAPSSPGAPATSGGTTAAAATRTS